MAGSDVLGGAASGAAAGSAAGPWGAVIGGVVGAIGGILGGKAKKKAKKATRRANELDRQAARLRSFAEQRNLLRTGQAVAAASVNSSVSQGVDASSSAFQGSRSSIYTQLLDNFLLGEAIVTKQEQRNEQLAKADKAAGQYDSIMDVTGAALRIGQVAGSYYNPAPKAAPTPAATPQAGGTQGAIDFDNGVRTYPVPW